ncbi:type II toxin-antitoxin system VapC family toxin [Candidatus Woesearchaeota archaeon]|nr:type II toxin-antitoxin system VapC family toxin [Candidatus Woesearchaeota archaeon]
MICIDSDCIIDFLRGNKEAIEVIKKYKDEIATTEVNIFEIFSGIYLRDNISEREEEITKQFFTSLNILYIDGWGIKAAKIFSSLVKEGKMIDQNDCFISAIMLVNGCNRIITRNIKHFSRIKGIDVISY